MLWTLIFSLQETSKMELLTKLSSCFKHRDLLFGKPAWSLFLCSLLESCCSRFHFSGCTVYTVVKLLSSWNVCSGKVFRKSNKWMTLPLDSTDISLLHINFPLSNITWENSSNLPPYFYFIWTKQLKIGYISENIR